MRTVAAPFLAELDADRQVGGRLTIRDNRLVFTERSLTETSGPTISPWEVDSCVYSAGVLRVAQDGGNLYWQYESDPTQSSWGSWSSEAYGLHTSCTPGIEGGRVYYLKSGGDLAYRDFTGSGWGGETVAKAGLVAAFGLPSSVISCAPVSTTSCYILSGPETGPVVRAAIIAVSGAGSLTATFHGRVFGDATVPYKFDAATLGGVDYVFVADNDIGRTLFSKVVNDVWSDFKHLVPLDVVDTDNKFEFGGVNVIDSTLVASGKYTRGTFANFDIYTRSLGDHWTMSRDLFITSGLTTTEYGKMFLIGTQVYYVCYGGVAQADATNLLGYDAVAHKLVTQDAFQYSLQTRPNQATRFSCQVSPSVTSALLRNNAEITVEASVGGIYETLGIVAVDVLGPAEGQQGEDLAVGGRGLASKRLDTWRSDQSYDYWSQSKVAANPWTLEDFVRTTGAWDQDDTNEELYLNSLNLDGYMYSVERASRGGLMRIRFKYPDDANSAPRIGVGVNYYRETKAEAAERLDVEQGEVEEGDYGHNGIFAVYGLEEHTASTEGVQLVFLKDSVETKLTSSALDLSVDTWYWLQILYQDGYIRVMYKTDVATAWTELFEYEFDEVDSPWFKNDVGRCAYFCNSKTSTTDTPGFSSSNTVVPVDSITGFPTTDTLQVDSEQIEYSGVSPDQSFTALAVVDGVVWPLAPHDNDWGGVSLYYNDYIDDTDADSDMPVGKGVSSTDREFSGAFQFYRAVKRHTIEEVWVYMRSVGTPTDNIELIIFHDDFDSFGDETYGLLGTSTTHTTIGSSYGWVKFDNFTGAEAVGGEVIIPSGSRGTGGIDYTVPDNYGIGLRRTGYAYHPSNYYEVKCDTQLRAPEDDIMLLKGHYNSAAYWYNVGNDTVRPGKSSWDELPTMRMCYDIVAKGLTGIGYEVFLDTAGSNVARDYYNDCALVCTEGPGLGQVFKVTDYDYVAPDEWVPSQTYNLPDTWQDHVGETGHGAWVTPDKRRVFVETQPYGVVSDETKFAMYRAFQVLNRGANGTAAVSHGATEVHLYRDDTVRVRLNWADAYSADVDMRIQDMAEEILAKSGTLDFSCAQILSGDQVMGAGWDETWFSTTLEYRNFVALLDSTGLADADEIGLAFRIDDTATITEGYTLALKRAGSTYSLELYKNAAGWSLLGSYTLPFAPSGWMRISVHKEHFSVWINGRFIHTFTDSSYAGGFAGIRCNGAPTVDVLFSELHWRADNFILDMGSRGTQLLNSLLNYRRVFWQDTEDGGFRMDILKSTGSADYTLDDLVWQNANSFMDVDQITFARGEGAEIAEVPDFALMKTEGYIFEIINAPLADDEWETQQEALAALEDAESSSSRKQPYTAADPRVEPNDIVDVVLPAGTATIIVDGVTFDLNVSGETPVFDMSVVGRDAN